MMHSTTYCILVAGLPATGKTTFAKWLSAEMGIPYMSKDDIKEILFDQIGFQSRAGKVALGVAAMDILYHFAESQMMVRRPCILENNFEDASMSGLLRLLEKYGCLPVTVLFDGDDEILHGRFLLRDQSTERHRGHVVNTSYPETAAQTPTIPLSLEAFVAGIENRGFRRFSVGGPELRVDSTDFGQVDYSEIYQRIKEILTICGR